MNVVLLIMTCEKYTHKAQLQRETWLKTIDIPFYHVIGIPTLKTEYEIDATNRMLYVKCNDDYNSLPKKVIRSYVAIIRENPSINYIFKTDDDQNLLRGDFFEKLIKVLHLKKADYGGQLINVDKPYISQYYRRHPELPHDLKVMPTKYCSGRFYFLSYNSLNALLNCRSAIECEYLEDYAIGYNLLQANKHLILMNIDTNKNFEDFIISK